MRNNRPTTDLDLATLIPQVFNHKGEAVTTSLNIAKVFHKRHADILRAVENLECSAEFSQRNFAPSDYTNSRGKNYPIYRITFDGFIFLVMGFSGKKAAKLKEAYIQEFNRMKNWIITRGQVSDHQHLLNDAIKQQELLTGYRDKFAYIRENELIYLVAIGAKRSKWLKDNGLPPKEEIRKHLSDTQLKLVDMLIAENATMIKLGMPYAQRRNRLQLSAMQYWQQLAEKTRQAEAKRLAKGKQIAEVAND